MDCCHTQGCDALFDRRQAARDLKRYRRRGPDRTTALLLAALRAEGITGASLLDVGGGIGAIHHELLEAGVASATHVDASSAYLQTAREEAARRGHHGRTDFRYGDFVTLASDLPSADIVTLDRVICCYPDVEALVAASAGHARRFYGAVFPRPTWLVRALFAGANLFCRLRRTTFRVFVHAPEVIDAGLRRQGLRPRVVRDTIVWRVVVYAR